MSVYPYGWTDDDLAAVADMASRLGSTPEYLLALWDSESGLQPHLVSQVGPGYWGLIMGAPIYVDPAAGWPAGTWRNVVTNGSIRDQLQAIETFWSRLAQSRLGESFAARADKLGVDAAAVIYAMNFLPGIAPNMRSADQPLTVRGQSYYNDNAGLDINGDGAISIRDLEARLDGKRQQLASSTTWGNMMLAANQAGGGLFRRASLVSGNSRAAVAVRAIQRSPLLLVLTVGGIVAAGLGVAWWLNGRKMPRLPLLNPIKRAAKPRRARGGSSRVQSLLFDRSKFTTASARAWAHRHGYKAPKVDITDRYIRLRQQTPGGFKRLRTVTFGHGVKAVVGWK